MVRYLCQSCNSTYVDNHKCFFYKKYYNVYSLPQQDKLDEKDAKDGEAKDEFTANSNDKSGKLSPVVELSDTVEFGQLNSLLTKNNEQVAFIRALERKRNFFSLSDKTSNNAQNWNSYDALVHGSTLNVRANEVHSEEKEYFKSSSGSFGSHYRFESGFSGDCKRKSCTIVPPLYEQNNGETRHSTSVHETSNEECEKSLEETKWRSFTNDKLLFMKSSDGPTQNARLNSKNLSETSNSPVSSAFSPRDKESDKDSIEVSRNLADTPISPEVVSRVTRSMTVNMKEPLVSMKDASSMAADLLQAEKGPFACHLCYKRFTLKSTLKKHYRTHTGEKPFICDRCEKVFAHKVTLDIHYRKHTGEKPFVCDVCNKCFASKISLTTHVRTHTGEKPYKCGICEKAFAQSGTRNTHCKLMHK